MSTHTITVTVNGQPHTAEVESRLGASVRTYDHGVRLVDGGLLITQPPTDPSGAAGSGWNAQ